MSEIQEAEPLKLRNSFHVFWDVSGALVLREFIAKTTENRMSWFWMLFEPLATVAVMLFAREYLRGALSTIIGAEYIPWLIIGLLTFYLFRDCMFTPMAAIDSSKSLFSYRQVLPIDTVISRCIVSGLIRVFLLFVIILIMFAIGSLDFPYDPLEICVNLFAIWFLGSSLGILLSAISTLVPEVGRIIRLTSMVLMIISGAMFPVGRLPIAVREFMDWNPIFIGIEKIRLGFFEYYHTSSNLSSLYMWTFSLAVMSLGLIMHVRFSNRFKML